jgi:hypothetical protein
MVSTGVQSTDLAAADFHGQGHRDLVVAGTAGVSMLTGDGTGHFGAPELKSTQSTAAVAAGDLDQDGKTDLAAAEVGGAVVMLGLGGGALGSPIALGAEVMGDKIQVVDATGDGHLDVLVTFESAGATPQDIGAIVVKGKGDGSFGSQMRFKGIEPTGAVVHDFNGDGAPDIAFADWKSGSIQLFDFSSNLQPRSFPFTAPNAIAGADLNGDGATDLVVADLGTPDGRGRGLDLLLGDGRGAFATSTIAPVGEFPEAIAIADFDDDHNADVAVLDGSRAVVNVLRGNGDGTFQAPVSLPLGIDPNAMVATDVAADAIVAADVNDDSLPDLIVTDWVNGQIVVLLNSSH